ncbi:hypothetical protein ACFO1B_25430 [Dactylosporangium siamense]|uniref:hypothetical protein n=1 Tax=Dactylosporangium siamense TaxID=685454 RepID=UPI0019414821|nr:hypothetical protein [Dactylosporangium siamense]
MTTREVPSGAVEPWCVRSATYTRDLPEVTHTGLLGALWHRRNAQLAEFAGHLGVSERMISRWEAGGEAIIPGQ